jgi:hypothetical protein
MILNTSNQSVSGIIISNRIISGGFAKSFIIHFNHSSATSTSNHSASKLIL